MNYDDIVTFHGHSCPGLAIGYRMSLAAMDFMSRIRAADEELVAIVENDACGVDALQCLTGCTFGKGNLVFKDYGKHVYTLFCRDSKRGVRVVLNHKNIPEEVRGSREKFVQWLLKEPQEKVVKLEAVEIEEPPRARVIDPVTCDFCGETVMKTRTVRVHDKTSCIPCAENNN